jgi:5-methylcytosine-specific restriction endonuclease McrA
MSITLLTGLPGSGKSRLLIELVNSANAEGRPVQAFVCSDFPWPSHHDAFWNHRRIVCGKPGLTCQIDHFVSREEAAGILADAPAGSLAAIEEGYAFTRAAVDDWRSASDRGVEVVVAAPSDHQVCRLDHGEYSEINLDITCQRCESRKAVEVIIESNGEGTLSVCGSCFEELTAEARSLNRGCGDWIEAGRINSEMKA